MRAAAVAAAAGGLALAFASSTPTTSCTTDLDCSLNGVCGSMTPGVCSCDPGWVAADCSALNISSVDPHNGRNGLANGSSSWGGGVLLGPDGKTYHMFYSKMVGTNCTLSQWTTNSACWRATSTSPLGPFTDAGAVMNSFCHNAVPALAPDNTYLLYHIGCGNSTPVPCGGAGGPAHPSSSSCGLTPFLMTAPAPEGPWTPSFTPLLAGVPGAWDASVTNVAPVFLPNGTVLLAYRGKSSTNAELLGAASAPSWRGPYTRSVQGPIVSAPGEDPFPYVDSRGGVHMLFHDFSSTSGGHVFAESWTGPWHYTGQPAYNLSVLWSNGTVAKLSRRERPQLFLDAAGSPEVLYTGVVPGPDAKSDACFTMAAAVGRG
jgi:hypothetical protein